MGPNHDAVDSSALLAEINTQIRQQSLLFDMAEFDEVPLENAREAIPVGPYSAEAPEEELTCLSFGQEVRTNRSLPNRGIFK